ncbi:MAG TPA: mechanosensitive ion channel domain-containing protein, partial [Pseudomonadales bacterium]|nr:mechanosensitive ion channel domain-containing protein [Pseudomonadales bacterium]
MTYRTQSKLLVTLFVLALNLPALAQEPVPAPGAITTPAATQNISLTQIADQTLATGKLIDQLSGIAAQPLELEVLSDQLTNARKQIQALQVDSAALTNNSHASIDQLNGTQNQWLFISEQLRKAQQRLKARDAELENAISQLTTEEDRWQKIKAQVSSAPGLNYNGSDINDAFNHTSRARKLLTTPLQETLGMDKDCQELIDIIDQELLALKSSKSYLRDNLFKNFQQPIWKISADDFKPQSNTEQSLENKEKLATFYIKQNPNRLTTVSIIVFLVGFFIWRVRVTTKRKQEEQMGIALRLPLIDRPFSTVIIIGVAATYAILPNPPQLIYTGLSLLLFIPVIRLGFPRLLPIVRPLAWLVSIFFIINSLSVHIHSVPALLQLWLLASAIIGLVGCIRALMKFSASDDRKAFVWRFLRATVWLALLAALVAAIGCITGAVTLAQFLLTSVAYSAYAGLLLVVVAGVFNDLITAALYMPGSNSSLLIRRNRITILRFINKLTNAICLISWINFAMKLVALRDSFFDIAQQIINKELSVGSISFSLGDMLSVAFTIWLSFKISQLLRFILVDDIAPRAKWARGVPEAVATITQYCLVLTGFMIAISMAGIDMSKLSIMVGALGVGIGIGLQDVVNNFTSGLILLFEQKIKQADIIQCSGVNGKVTNIGMRCSVVRTFDGAEVIVPNGQLVSAQVINWTHSDQER